MSSMGTESVDRKWVKQLPRSRMVYPTALKDRTKYIFYQLYTPYHSFFRDMVLALGLVKHEGRQDYVLGTIAPHLSIKEFIIFLIDKGFGNHFIAWEDEGQLVSLRYVTDFAYQYHVRVFEDREVRAHYEYTPECYPLKHMYEVDFEPRRDEFLEMLGDTIIYP